MRSPQVVLARHLNHEEASSHRVNISCTDHGLPALTNTKTFYMHLYRSLYRKKTSIIASNRRIVGNTQCSILMVAFFLNCVNPKVKFCFALWRVSSWQCQLCCMRRIGLYKSLQLNGFFHLLQRKRKRLRQTTQENTTAPLLTRAKTSLEKKKRLKYRIS